MKPATQPHWESCWWPRTGRPGVCGRPAVAEVVFWQDGSRVALHVCHQHRQAAEQVEARHNQGAA